jgi:acetylcholinesterase
LEVIQIGLQCKYTIAYRAYIHLCTCTYVSIFFFFERWGQSAGSMSILAQMLAFGGIDEGLFHAAFMMSGYTQPILSVDQAQFSYDQIVEYTGCSSPLALAAYENSTFECLREAPFESIVAAVNNTAGLLSYAGLNLTFGPRVEGPGGFLQDTFRQGIAKGKYVKVPIVAGECADEGT